MSAAEIDSIEKITELVPHLLDIAHKKILVDCDQEADVLYVNFKKPNHFDDPELTVEDVIVRYEGRAGCGHDLLPCQQEKEIP